MSIEELKRPERVDEDKIEKLKELFPEAFIEGKLNIDIMKEELTALNDDSFEENIEEFYSLNWTGKKEARKLAFVPPQGTLTFTKGEGVNENETKNIFIEGDNLEVLRILQKSYAGKVKCIYIDPPYNTGKDFVYKDDYKDSVEKYLQKSGQVDEVGLLTSNPKANGRYHANWMNMIYPRLKLARNLLKDDGVIFVSIDDNEQANLKKILDEIFGEENFVTNIIWQKKYSPQNDALYFSDMHDFILVYAKKKKQSSSDKDGWNRRLLPRTQEQNSKYKNPDNDPRGPWKAGDLTSKTKAANHSYPIKTPSGKIHYPSPGRQWAPALETFNRLLTDNRIWFGKDGNNMPAQKIFLSEVQDGSVPNTIWLRSEAGDNQEATQELKKLFPDTPTPFDTPKPVRLIKRILQLATDATNNDIVLDFFAGSGTTGEAVLEMNKEDGGNRQFILVQIPETINNKTFGTISNVTKERLRRVLNRINNENLELNNIDKGFAVYQLSKSNLRKWEGYKGNDVSELDMTIDLFNSTQFFENTNQMDIIVEMMLLHGFKLDSSIQHILRDSNELWIVNHADVPFNLIVCLDNTVQEKLTNLLCLNYKKAIFICMDDALTNEQKIQLSQSLSVKTI